MVVTGLLLVALLFTAFTRVKQTAHKHLITLKDGVVIYTLL